MIDKTIGSSDTREKYSQDANFLPSQTSNNIRMNNQISNTIESGLSAPVKVEDQKPIHPYEGVHNTTNDVVPRANVIATAPPHETKKYYVSQKDRMQQKLEQSQVIHLTNLKI